MKRRLPKKFAELLAITGAPRLGFRCVEKILLNGGFYSDRELDIEFFEVIGRSRAPCFWSRKPEFFGQLVGVPFIPGPLYRFPIWRWNAEPFSEFRAVARKRSDKLIACGIKDPAFQIQPLSDINERIDGFSLFAKGGNTYVPCCVSRKTGDGILIIYNASGYPMATKAASYGETVKISTQNHGTHLSLLECF